MSWRSCCRQASVDFEFGSRKHFPVFRENDVGDIQPGWFGDRKQKDGALESVWFQGSRDDDIGIDDEPKWDHPRFRFYVRAALMTWSICPELEPYPCR